MWNLFPWITSFIVFETICFRTSKIMRLPVHWWWYGGNAKPIAIYLVYWIGIVYWNTILWYTYFHGWTMSPNKEIPFFVQWCDFLNLLINTQQYFLGVLHRLDYKFFHKGHCSIPCSFDITRDSSLVVNHRTEDVWVTSDRPGTP